MRLKAGWWNTFRRSRSCPPCWRQITRPTAEATSALGQNSARLSLQRARCWRQRREIVDAGSLAASCERRDCSCLVARDTAVQVNVLSRARYILCRLNSVQAAALQRRVGGCLEMRKCNRVRAKLCVNRVMTSVSHWRCMHVAASTWDNEHLASLTQSHFHSSTSAVGITSHEPLPRDGHAHELLSQSSRNSLWACRNSQDDMCRSAAAPCAGGSRRLTLEL